MEEKEILEKVGECIVNFNIREMKQVCQDALGAGIPPIKIITEGMGKGMDTVGRKYECGEYFLAELITAGEVMEEGMRYLEPYLKRTKTKKLGKVVLGTIEGDLHDIGKNIVATLLSSAGFEVVDLGVDVPVKKFLDEVCMQSADILGVSSLLTTTALKIENMVKELERAKWRNKVKVIVGGAALSEEFAKRAGADAYASNAIAGVNICKKWMGQKS